jgi:hypothetical protein
LLKTPVPDAVLFAVLDRAPHVGVLEDRSGWKAAGISLESGRPMLGNAG